MSKYYFVKASCPNSPDDNVFFNMVDNALSQNNFETKLYNIPWKLDEASVGDYVFLQLGGDSGRKRTYFSEQPELASFENAIYAIGTIKSISVSEKALDIGFFPFSFPITKIDLYLYPQFIDTLGCSSKGTPNQAGLHDVDESVALSLIEYLVINNKVGNAKEILKGLTFKGFLKNSAKEFYDDHNSLLILPSSTVIKNILSEPIVKKTIQYATKCDFNIFSFIDSLSNSNLSFPESLSYRFISSLQTKPFTILTGLSGSGKTKLAEAFSLWISEDSNQICMIAVGADWTNREPLLGYPNALEPNQYVKPDCGALDIIISAVNDPTRPYFLVLDEMNMSHVERYFADFLSAMESTEGSISLHSGTEDWNGVPPSICLPKNLFIIGTVNIDETTYMFSPKVLDRANVIEFRVSDTEMQAFFNAPKALEMDSLRGAGASMGESFVANALKPSLVDRELGDALMPFFKELQKVGVEFGYRTATEMSRFVAICSELAKDVMTKEAVIDAAIMQKLLPKLHGSRNKIEPILKTLGKLCLENTENEAFLLGDDKKDKHEVKYTLSYEKLMRMHDRVVTDGFTSFAEA